MRTDIFLNSRAGRSDLQRLMDGIKKALYRCELHFHEPASVNEFKSKVREVVKDGATHIIVCGGDGTMNLALNSLMQIRDLVTKLPPVVLIPSGTANDLAHNMRLTRRIDRAARMIFEGTIRMVDVLEIEADGKKAYMITNGGLGIPASTARKANVFRKWIKHKAHHDSHGTTSQTIWNTASNMVSAAGSRIYELMLVNDLAQWDDSSWDVEVTIKGRGPFWTKAPFIMISNQPSLGKKFKPAPFTSNSDGAFNVMLINSQSTLGQIKSIFDFRFGRVPDGKDCPSFETEEVRLRAADDGRCLTFFGDGEILHKSVREIVVRCIHPGLPVVTMGEE